MKRMGWRGANLTLSMLGACGSSSLPSKRSVMGRSEREGSSARLGARAPGRPWARAWAALLLCGCCFGGGEPPVAEPRRVEVAPSITIPVSLEQARTLALGMGSEPTLERVRDSAGGASCSRSPLCVLVLPLVFARAMFPPEHDLVTVSAAGEVIYQGQFTTEGALIRARGREGSDWVDVEPIELPYLGRHLVAVTYRTAIDSGPDGIAVPVRLEGQFDLVDAYRERGAIANTDLLGEAVSFLGEDATVLVVEALEQEEPSLDSTAGHALELCAWQPALTRSFREAGEMRDRLARAASAHPDGPAAVAALACLEPSSLPPEPNIEILARGVITAECNRANYLSRALERTSPVRTRSTLHRAQAEAAVGCSESPLLQIAAGVDVADDAIEAALQSSDNRSGEVVQILDGTIPSHRRALALGLRGPHPLHAAATLVASGVVPSSSELVDAVQLLLREERYGNGTPQPLPDARALLRLLAAAHADPALTAAARAAMSPVREGAPPELLVREATSSLSSL